MNSPSLASLAKRLEQLEDERAIVRLLEMYCHCLDYNLEKEFIDLFTEDATFEARYRQPIRGHKQAGRAALEQYIAKTRVKTQQVKHLMTVPRIMIDGDEARAESYLTVLAERDGLPFLWRFGRFRDRVVKRNGKWLIAERVVEVELTAPGGV